MSLDSRATNTRLICKYSTNLSKKRSFRLTRDSLYPILRDKFVLDSFMDLNNGTQKLVDVRLIRCVAINRFSTVIKYRSTNQYPLAKSKHSDSSLSSPTRKIVYLTQSILNPEFDKEAAKNDTAGVVQAIPQYQL